MKFIMLAMSRVCRLKPNRCFVVALEGKGPRDPLDRPFAGRRMSEVDQGYRYAINQLEHQLSDLVNEAHGLTPDEVALMWQTALPRMPFTPPAR